MTINELQSKGVFKDPLFLYDQFKKAYNKYYNIEDYDIEENPFAEALLSDNKRLFKVILDADKGEKETLKEINFFFKDFYKLLNYVRNYCNAYKLEWDIYPSFLNNYSCDGFNFSLNFLIKLEDFDLVGSRNNKVWSYKDPYMIIPTVLARWGIEVDIHNISVFFGKINVLGFIKDFNHPHIKNYLRDRIFNSNAKEADFGQILYDSATKGNFCYGNSNLQYQRLICDNQDEFNFFMFRFTNYIKEYNSFDCFKKVPTGLSIPLKKSLIDFEKNDYIISSILNSGFKLKPSYFYFVKQKLEIVDYFYKDLIIYYINNDTQKAFNDFMLNNLTDGNHTLNQLLSLSIEDDVYKTILEDNKPFHFTFNKKEVKLELYYEKNEVAFEYQDLYLTEDTKNYLKNQLIKYVNG